MDKVSYKGFKVGQRVVTIASCYDSSSVIPIGTEFTIKDFPPCTMFPNKHMAKYFVYGKTDNDRSIRIFTDEIAKLK